jgi:uncharacterized protein
MKRCFDKAEAQGERLCKPPLLPPIMEDATITAEIPVIDITDDSPAPSTSPAAGFVPLTFEQARVLGCLVEKEITTPDYYPLTLNSLVTACNQSTNRDPVTAFSEGDVQAALDGLKVRQFAFQMTIAGARVQKFRHNLLGKMQHLDRPLVALLTVLLLRGPQTIGELRQRSERLYNFPDLPSVETALQRLQGTEFGPALAVCFPPGPGRKSALFMHTLCGEPSPTATAGTKAEVASFEVTSTGREDDQLWRARLEAEVKALREELDAMKAKLSELL